MKASRLLPNKFSDRIVSVAAIAGLIPILIFATLLAIYGEQLSQSVLGALREQDMETWRKSETALRQQGESFVTEKARDIALQLELYMQAKPGLSMREFQGDRGLRGIALQTIGEKGYTIVCELGSHTILLHSDRKLQGTSMEDLPGASPNFLSILKETAGGKPANGYFRWKKPVKDWREQFMSVVPLKMKVADHGGINVVVIAAVDQFVLPVREGRAVQRGIYGTVADIVEDLSRSLRNVGIVFMVLGMGLVAIFAWFGGKYLSSAIVQLRRATKEVNKGNFNVSVPVSVTGDVGEFVDDFNKMVATLAATTVSKNVLEESERKFRSLAETTTAGILIYQDDRCVYANPAAERITGYTQAELKGSNFWEQLKADFGDSSGGARWEREKAIEGPEIRIRTKTSEEKWVEATQGYMSFEGSPAGIVTIYDITQRKSAEALLAESEERYRTVIEHSNDGVAILKDETFLYVNERFVEIFGYEEPAYFTGKRFSVTVHPDDRQFMQDLEEKRGAGEDVPSRHEFKGVKMDGETIYIEVSRADTLFRGEPVSLVYLRDITERKQSEERLKYLSLHDTLTGLYNRTYFAEEMRRFEAGRFDPAGLIICDVDGLKLVNDTLGHEAGDRLLLAAAGVLKESFRESDVVARVGGDEFAILLARSTASVAETLCKRIRDGISRFNESGGELYLSVSVGYTIREDTTLSMTELYKEADNNMYREKLYSSQNAKQAIVKRLMNAAEEREASPESEKPRLQNLMVSLAELAGFPAERMGELRLLARFHDIGTVNLSDQILTKKGPLNLEEMGEVRRHCEVGQRIARFSPELLPISDLILKHHEWWDGRGYPQGLKKDEIPIESRMLAIADAYVAMTSDRPYRKRLSPEDAKEELKKYAGIQFDPFLVQQFVDLLDGREKEGVC